MKSFSMLSIGSTVFCGLSAFCARSASAHIDLMGDLKARGGDEKSIPCDGPKGSTVYTFEPGATVKIIVGESVAHDSYFRVAFDNDSATATDLKDPASIDPINPNRVSAGGIGSPRSGSPKCLADTTDSCGKSDFCSMKSTTGPTVLYDNIEPHLGRAAKASYTWTVKLPEVECESCTLQVIQVMEDIAFGAHGPYDGSGDVYHRCIDIKLEKGAGTGGPGNAPGPAMMGAAMDCSTGVMGMGTAVAGTGAGGSAAAGSSSSGVGGGAGNANAGAAGMVSGARATTGSAGVGTTAGMSTGAAGIGPITGAASTAGRIAAVAPAGTSATAPTAGSSATLTPATMPTSSAAPASSSGGCSVSGHNRQSCTHTLGLALLALALAFARHRVRSRQVDQVD